MELKDSLFDYAVESPSLEKQSLGVPERFRTPALEAHLRKEPLPLPNLPENLVARYYTRLSQMNFSVDTHFYPLGSCTMKYNPKLNERLTALPSFAKLHPYQSEEEVQGILEVGYRLGRLLCEITGLDEVSLVPAAGAHGELTGLLMARAYFQKVRKEPQRTVVLIPDSAHGTNPATASMAGFVTRSLRTGSDGTTDVQDLEKRLNGQVAVLMITHPNTLGIFEKNIVRMAQRVHEAGALVYMDGANLNALLGLARPGEFGVDMLHSNLHKTFSVPHGGGGPGAGALLAKRFLRDFLPIPLIERSPANPPAYRLNVQLPHSIGRLKTFHGHASCWIRALAYISRLGREGLRQAAETAILNANYLCKQIQKTLEVPYPNGVLHEFVASGKKLLKYDVRTLDVAKRLLDYGVYAPTIYFPLIVSEALMIEPTETESKETLDGFVAALEQIVNEAKTQPDLLHHAPHTLSVSRLDEVQASRQPNLRWQPSSPKA